MLKKIISGGQTGIDKMGLIIGQQLGYETGGTAPTDFITENGVDYTLNGYGLTQITPADKAYYETVSGKKDRYTARTYVNTRDSDGTVYFSTDSHSPGSKTTRNGCTLHKKPFIMNPNVETLCKWIDENNIETLNVAGNRGSKLSSADARRFATILETVLKHYKE